MKQVVIQVITTLPKEAFKTTSVDRGKEFALHNEIETSLNVSVYFADPYCSWQRGNQ